MIDAYIESAKAASDIRRMQLDYARLAVYVRDITALCDITAENTAAPDTRALIDNIRALIEASRA